MNLLERLQQEETSLREALSKLEPAPIAKPNTQREAMKRLEAALMQEDSSSSSSDDNDGEQQT